ncbi:MAG: biotin synthase BioB [Planctomycetaceae bacterium]|nr:MAG: biotin synthase BioB [Planctomycetaceae bacterium]
MMPSTAVKIKPEQANFDGDWQALSERVLSGQRMTLEEGIAVLQSPDNQLLEVLSAAYRIRHHYFGNTVQLYFLINAKSGLCPEDCSYCSQSKVSQAPIPKYNILQRDQLMEGARLARERNARTYCIVISARSPNEREMQAVEELVPEIKSRYGLHVCASLGLLSEPLADRLKACGVDRINHNLNTSAEHYPTICSTHSYQDRIETLRAVRNAGMELCSGGIIGMGERDEDIVQMAIELREIGVESIPLNFLNAIEGTPLGSYRQLNPRHCLRALAVFRFANPDREIRIAGGRELHLGCLQPLGLYAANSIFVGDYLTTQGQIPEADYRMIEEMGFEVTSGRPTESTNG